MRLRIMLLLHETKQLAPGSGSLWLVSGILQLSAACWGSTHRGTGHWAALRSSSPFGKPRQHHSAPGSPGYPWRCRTWPEKTQKAGVSQPFLQRETLGELALNTGVV